jgi:histidinol-phosphatase
MSDAENASRAAQAALRRQVIIAPREVSDMEPRELQRILDFAVDCAHEAGTLTLGHFRAGTAHELKADNSPVTVADRGSERLMRERIERAYPTHGILGEEFGEKVGSEPARWILDPIDGTMSFISGVPLFSVLVGYETVYGARGLGCRCNGRPARVSGISDLEEARMVVTSVKAMYEHGRGPAFERLRDACKTDRGWSDAYGYALLATGRAEIVLDPVMSVWDIAALIPVVREAGGTLTDWSGRVNHHAAEALGTNGRLLEATLELIRGGA